MYYEYYTSKALYAFDHTLLYYTIGQGREGVPEINANKVLSSYLPLT